MLFDTLLSESIGVFAIAAIGLLLLQNKNLVMKLAGLLFCLLALAQVFSSPALMSVLALAGVLFGLFLIVRAVMKKRKVKKCARCEHAEHGHGPCANTHCSCPR